MARDISSAMLKQATSVAHLILHPPYPKIPPPVLCFGVMVPLPSPTLHHVLGMQNRCGILHSSFKCYPWLGVCLRCTAQLLTLCWSCTRKLWEHKLNLIGKRIFEKGSNRFVKIWRATSKAIQEFNSTVTEGRSSLGHQVADWNPRKTLHVSTHKVITYYFRTVHYSLAYAKLHRHLQLGLSSNHFTWFPC